MSDNLEQENIENSDESEVTVIDNTPEQTETNLEESSTVPVDDTDESESESESETERLRLEHEAYLNSFPSTTVFYQSIKDEDGIKVLMGTTKKPVTADKLGFLENHMDESELTFVPSNKELTSGVYYIKGHEKPESTIEELKAQKLAEISAEAHKYSQYECEEMYLTSSKGFKINADGRAQDNLKGLIALGVTCRFKDYDNEFHPGTTVEDLNVMLLECYQNGAMLYQKKFDYEALVANAKSREELYFDVVFDMADFSAK